MLLINCLYSFCFRCLPVHCKYSFFNLPNHTSLKKQHAQSIYWDDINVVLAGNENLKGENSSSFHVTKSLINFAIGLYS